MILLLLSHSTVGDCPLQTAAACQAGLLSQPFSCASPVQWNPRENKKAHFGHLQRYTASHWPVKASALVSRVLWQNTGMVCHNYHKACKADQIDYYSKACCVPQRLHWLAVASGKSLFTATYRYMDLWSTLITISPSMTQANKNPGSMIACQALISEPSFPCIMGWSLKPGVLLCLK